MKKQTKHLLERTFRSARRDLSFDKLVSAANQYFETVNTPVSLGCYLRLKYKSYDEYLSMDLVPSDYANSDMFYQDQQCVKLFSKAEFFPSIFDTEKVAKESFIQSEIACYQTNSKFIQRDDPDFRDHVLSNVSHIAKRKISRILGNCPDFQDIPISFGPGNNVGLSRNTSIIDKLTSVLTFTGNLKQWLPKIMETCPSWSCYRAKSSIPTPLDDNTYHVEVQEVAGSALGFVPKNAKTKRTICTEPLLNSFVQLGIGKVMRGRLRRSGCNLNSQARNQELARVGSLTNDLATIDLSSASDTISYMTVMELLPFPWFNLLDCCRSPNYTYEGKYYEFSKFSSMGNGYTFELESLIFLALSQAVCEVLDLPTTNVSIYGDDIIVPSKATALLRKTLEFYGFKVNEAKSFQEGPFRESCGKDWFLGQQVRPLYLKRRPSNATLIGWCNHIWRVDEGLYDFRWQALYDALYDLVDKPFHSLKGPDGFGDGHFVADMSSYSFRNHSLRRRGWEGYGYYTLGDSPLPRHVDSDAVYVAALYAAQNSQAVQSVGKQHISHSSQNGKYVAHTRGRVRTVVRRAFHP